MNKINKIGTLISLIIISLILINQKTELNIMGIIPLGVMVLMLFLLHNYLKTARKNNIKPAKLIVALYFITIIINIIVMIISLSAYI